MRCQFYNNLAFENNLNKAKLKRIHLFLCCKTTPLTSTIHFETIQFLAYRRLNRVRVHNVAAIGVDMW